MGLLERAVAGTAPGRRAKIISGATMARAQGAQIMIVLQSPQHSHSFQRSYPHPNLSLGRLSHLLLKNNWRPKGKIDIHTSHLLADDCHRIADARKCAVRAVRAVGAVRAELKLTVTRKRVM